MAKKISQLTQATEVKSDDVTVIVQDGETKKLPLNMMVTKQDIENKKVAGLAKLDEIEATYENDTYTPTITVKNKSSVKTGEGDEVDYSANVMDGHAKSAILKGQTLVNVFQFTNKNDFNIHNSINIEGTTIIFNADGTFQNFWLKNNGLVKANTDYLFIVDVLENTLIYKDGISDTANAMSLTSSSSGTTDNSLFQAGLNVSIKDLKDGKFVKKFSSNPTSTGTEELLTRSFLSTNAISGTLKIKLMIIEYQDGMENWDIPYFMGMQSVKLPVLTTTGKNLVNKENFVTGIFHSFNLEVLPDNTGLTFDKNNAIKVKPNTTYTLSCATGYKYGVLGLNATKTSATINSGWKYTPNGYTFTTDANTHYVTFNISKTDDSIIQPSDKDTLSLMVEQGTVATPYEPYKSNILRTPSDLELGGIGDVKDELNYLTGQVTERIGEVVLNGSENWLQDAKNDTYTSFLLRGTGGKISCFCVCDKLPQKNTPIYTLNSEGVVTGGTVGDLLIIIKKERLNTDSVSGFKEWLSQNNLTVQLQLDTPTIKTVDLMPSGTHPSTTPYCWKNGHIQLSSSGLLPNLEYSVVTSRAGQINQNATMIVKNDKRIFDLEILLAGGLVNTTYQALTLQNQVETGLSKVSLNSEKEPDYLLYHMIMKLIEEKAYKLDDLTEKVSVFYLYEKLSDEQFETIYSALYPFVEDEIVEEPVVEELPEVVEDEVIM